MPQSLPRYVALLRALNVGGHAVVKMADLRTHCESFGLTDVVTYIQSGNVIFSAPDGDRRSLVPALEQHLAARLGYPLRVFVLNREELAKAAAANPFVPQADDEQCYLLFMSARPEEAREQALMKLQGEEYRFAIRDKVLYYAYAKATAGRRRTINLEKVLGVVGTARSWKVVDKLIELVSTPIG